MTHRHHTICAAPGCPTRGKVRLSVIGRRFGAPPGLEPDPRLLCRKHAGEFAWWLRSQVAVQPELLPSFDTVWAEHAQRRGEREATT